MCISTVKDFHFLIASKTSKIRKLNILFYEYDRHKRIIYEIIHTMDLKNVVESSHTTDLETRKGITFTWHNVSDVLYFPPRKSLVLFTKQLKWEVHLVLLEPRINPGRYHVVMEESFLDQWSPVSNPPKSSKDYVFESFKLMSLLVLSLSKFQVS